jgi:hypothetical protein
MEVNLIDELHSILALCDSKIVDWWIYQILPYLEFPEFFTFHTMCLDNLLALDVELSSSVADQTQYGVF